MIDILSLNPMILFGTAGAIGAGVRGAIAYYKLKQDKPKLEFDKSIFSDTVSQGIVGGIAFSAGLPVSYVSLGVVGLASAGIDSFFNKFGIKIIPVLRDIALGKKVLCSSKSGSKSKKR